MGELQARQPLPLGESGQPGQADPGSGADGPFSRPLQAVQLRGVDRQHVQSLVRRQQVGPAAQGQQGPALLLRQRQQGGACPEIPGPDEAADGASDPEGGVLFHRLLPENFQLREAGGGKGVEAVKPWHRGKPPEMDGSDSSSACQKVAQPLF